MIKESTYEVVSGVISKGLGKKGKLIPISSEELRIHNNKDDGWIAVNGYVYNITDHVKNHPGWYCGCASSTLSAILRTLGTDCTAEVLSVHSNDALIQLQGYMIGYYVP